MLPRDIRVPACPELPRRRVRFDPPAHPAPLHHSACSFSSFLAESSKLQTNDFPPNSFPFTHLQIPRPQLLSFDKSPKSRGDTPRVVRPILFTVGCRLSPFSCPLTPFPTSLSQKQGGTRHWSYQRSSLPTVGCRLLAFPSASPPCSTPRFPLKWELPFPVLTGVKP